MKVVLFCGGRGTRLRDYSDEVPKPMVTLGYRPILWHIMKYYAHFGHRDFILCLGYRADSIKEFFLNYEEAVSNDFVLRRGGREKMLLASDIDDWTITFVDTGIDTTIAGRLLRVRKHLAGEEMFLANYADGVTDLDLNAYVDEFKSRDEMLGGLLAVRPPQSYHVVDIADSGSVNSIGPIGAAPLRLNGGYFVFRQEMLDEINPGEDIVEPLERVSAEGRLYAHRFDGFWSPMDTFKEKVYLDDLYESGAAPWVVWKTNGT